MMQRVIQSAVCLAALIFTTVFPVRSADLVRLAHYGFEGNANDSTGRQVPFELLWNASITNGVLCLGPAFDAEARTPRLNGFSYPSFTVAVDFKLREFEPFGNLILSGGPSYRWFTLETWNELLMARFDTKNGEYLMGSENVRVTTNQWYQAVVSANLDTGLVQIHLNGVLVLERNIGSNAEFNVVGMDFELGDRVFSFRNYGNAATLRWTITPPAGSAIQRTSLTAAAASWQSAAISALRKYYSPTVLSA